VRVITARRGSGVSEVADWLARSTAPGVVWSHNFDSAFEVDQFRDASGTGLDPTGAVGTHVTWDGADGFAGGGSLQIQIPTGGTCNSFWTRPFSALRAGKPVGGGNGNGRAVDDRADSGAVALQTWDSSQTSTPYNWRKGYHANAQVQSDFPYWPDVGHTGVYDGTTFEISFRVKISASRWTSGNPPGKLAFIDVTEGLSNLQEMVIRSANKSSDLTGVSYYQTNPFLVYTSRGSYANSIVSGTQGDYSGVIEPGGPYAGTCTYGNAGSAGACWEYPADQWTTLRIRVTPGRDNSAYSGDPPGGALATWPYHDHGIEVWKCDQGETSWTKIFEHTSLAWFYYSDPQSGTNGPNGMWHAPAFNVFTPSGYMNGVNAVAGWTQKFAQIIFAHSFIAAPQR
jgi:hypothetical protein